MKKLATLLFSIIFLTSFTACQKIEDWENQKSKTADETNQEVTEEEASEEEEKATTEETVTEETTTETPATEEPAKVQEVKTFNITAKQFEFTPNTISVNEGNKVVVNLTSTDVDHGFAVTEYGISETVTAGETKTIEFTADKKGTFTFKCPVPCGEGHMDMIGNLIVN